MVIGFLASDLGWKLNPVVGAVYGPEFYAGKKLKLWRGRGHERAWPGGCGQVCGGVVWMGVAIVGGACGPGRAWGALTLSLPSHSHCPSPARSPQ